MRVYDAAGNLKTIDVLAAHNLLSASHGDTLAAGVVQGDLVIGNGSPAWARLPIGGANTVPHSDGTDITWQALVIADLPATVVLDTETPSGGEISGTFAAGLTIDLEAVSLDKLVHFKENSLLGKDTLGTGDPLVMDEGDIATVSPVGADFILGWTAAGLLRKYTVTSMPGGTHPVVETDGGTGQTSYTQGDILYSDVANSLLPLAVGGVAQVLHGGATIPVYGAIVAADITNENVTLDKLVHFKENSLLGKDTLGTGDPLVMDEGDIATVTPVDADFLLGWTAAGLLRKYLVSGLPGGGGGTPVEVNNGGTLGNADFTTTTEITVAEAAGVITMDLVNNTIVNARLSDMAANTVKVNATASPAVPADLAVSANQVVGRAAGNIVSATLATGQVTDSAITYGKIQNVVSDLVFLGNNSGAGSIVDELTATEATAILDLFATGATTKGVVPGSNSVGATFYLDGSGVWSVPAGGGDVVGPGSSVDNEIVRFDSTTGLLIQAYTSLGPTVGDDGEVDFQSRFDLSGEIDITVSADLDDWAPAAFSTASTIHVTVSGADHTIGGLTGNADGRIVIITNVGPSNRLILNDEDGGSTSNLRFTTGMGDMRLEQDESAVLQYDNTTARWRVIAVNRGLVDLVNDVSNVLEDGSGGTNTSTYAQGDILFANATNVLAKLGGGTAFQHLRMNSAGTFQEWATRVQSKSITIPDPVDGDQIPMFQNDAAITILGVSFASIGGTSIPFNLEYAATISPTGTVIHSDVCSTSTPEWGVSPTGTVNVPIDQIIQLDIGLPVGTPTFFTVTFTFRENV